MNNKTALIAGATGLTGSFLLQKLLSSDIYSSVTAIVRQPLDINHPKLKQIISTYESLDNNAHEIVGTDIFCCLGTTIKKAGSKEAFRKIDYHYPLKLATIAKNNGASCFVVISSMGASTRSRIFYSKVKGEIEEALTMLAFDELHIMRPSLLLGKRKGFRAGEYMGTLIYKALQWVFIGPLRPYKGIKASDVAEAMFVAAQQEKKGTHMYPSHIISKMSSSK